MSVIYDGNTGRYGHVAGNGGEGSDWREGYDAPACECTPDGCLDSCEAQGCKGYIRSLSEASGLRWAWDPDTCKAIN